MWKTGDTVKFEYKNPSSCTGYRVETGKVVRTEIAGRRVDVWLEAHNKIHYIEMECGKFKFFVKPEIDNTVKIPRPPPPPIEYI